MGNAGRRSRWAGVRDPRFAIWFGDRQLVDVWRWCRLVRHRLRHCLYDRRSLARRNFKLRHYQAPGSPPDRSAQRNRSSAGPLVERSGAVYVRQADAMAILTDITEEIRLTGRALGE